MDWCKNPEKGLVKPDIIFYLDLDVEIGTKRGNYGEEIYERKEY